MRTTFLPSRRRGLAALVGALIALSACAGPEVSVPTRPPDSANLASPTDAVIPPDSGVDTAAVTISFAAQEFERQSYAPLIADFNRQNPAIHVQFVPLEMGATPSVDELMRQTVSAADTAESFFLRAEDIQHGLVRDLKPLIDADASFDQDDFYPGALATSGANGGIYILPRTLRVALLSYNKELWARRGLAPPKPDWSWSDVLAAAEQLAQKRGDTTDVYGLADGQGGLAALVGLLHESGVKLPTDGTPLRIDQPQIATMIERVTALVKSGAIYSDSKDQLAPDTFLKLIADQRVAMWFGAPVMIGPDVPKPAFATGAAALPSSSDADFGGSEGYIMSSGTTHPEAAWRWLAFLSRQEVRRPFMDTNVVNSVPARKSLAERSGYWKQLDAETTAVVQATLARARSPLANLPNLADQQLASTVLAQALADVVGGKPVARALSEAQAKIDQQLADAQSTPSPTADPRPIVVATPMPDGPAPGATTISFNVPIFQAEQFRRLANEFNQQHPELFVQINSSPMQEDMTLTKMAAAADCFSWPDPAAASQISGTLDLQPLIDADANFALDDYPPALLAPFKRALALYGLPYQLQLRSLTYNQTAFDSAGLAYPSASWTADDLLSAAKQLTNDASDKRYGYAALGTQTDDLLFFLKLLGAQITRDEKPNFTDPQVEQAARFYIDLLRNYSPHTQIQGYTRSIALGGETFELVENGHIGMWFDLPGGMQIVRIGGDPAGRQSFTRAIAPPPGAGKATSDIFNVSGLYISATSQQSAACWQWLKFLSNDLTALAGNFPARRSLAESDAFAKSAPVGAAAVYAAYRPALDRAPDSAGQPVGQERAQLDLFWFFRAVDRALQGKDLGRELGDAQALTEQYLTCVAGGAQASVCATQVDPSYEGQAGAGGNK